MKTEQICTALEICKGKPVSEIKMLMGLWGEDSVSDLAKFFNCDTTADAVAECLSKGLSAIKKEKAEEKPAEVAEIPAESAESVAEDTDVPENGNVSEESEGDSADTEEEGEESEGEEEEEKPAGSAEKKTDTKGKDKGKDKKAEKPKEEFKSNLPTGLSFNPLVMAIKPFYDKLIAEDEIFANVVKERENRKEKPKSLAECADYIMSEAYNYAKSHRNGNFGMAGFPDEDMYRLIRHYYDEEFLEVHKVTNAKAVVSAVPTPKSPAKVKEKEKPVKNVVDITKAIVSATKTEDGKKKGKAKENLNAGFIPMERPETLKDAKKTSRQQAKSVETIDMFADFFANTEE